MYRIRSRTSGLSGLLFSVTTIELSFYETKQDKRQITVYGNSDSFHRDFGRDRRMHNINHLWVLYDLLLNRIMLKCGHILIRVSRFSAFKVGYATLWSYLTRNMAQHCLCPTRLKNMLMEEPCSGLVRSMSRSSNMCISSWH